MILRRVIAHFRKQEWTAIAIDFVIVVAGVFVGIQVANWNDARKDAALHDKLLQRLEEEFRALEPVVAELAAFAKSSHESTGRVIEALRLERPPEDEAAFRFALGRSNWVQNVPQIATTYEELVATGRLSDIRDIELRHALIRYGDAHERVERIYPAATSVIFDPDSNYYRSVDWNMNPETWQSEGAVLAYDWDALRASRAEMQGWISYQYDLALFAEKEVEEIRNILAAINNGRK